ncbi:MAG: amidase [Litoreibacter sp.]
MSEPCDLSATMARAYIEDGSLSVTTLLESCIARIEERNLVVNAVVATCFDEARQQARQMDADRPAMHDLPPLFGLPVLVKDLINTKGLRTTYGSLCFDSHVPVEDGDVVVALRDAGAIIIGKTNTPEFGAGANTFNKVYGATRNPHNTDLTCGGSSGGSAVAVACGMAPLAIGSDFGGSLRIPASFCGIVGMRPTPGRVPCAQLAVGHSPLWTEGPMARNVGDAALCLSAIEGYRADDPRAAPLDSHSVPSPVSLAQLNVGVSSDLGLAALDDDIRAVFQECIDKLKPSFASIETVSPQLQDAPDVFRTIRILDVFAGTHNLAPDQIELLGDNVKTNIALAEGISLADVARSATTHTRMFKEFQKLFDTHDVLICPATAVSPFPVDQHFPSEMNGKPLDDYVSWYAITWALSLMGCPIVTIPVGNDHKGMPFGIQVIAPRHQDQLALNAAAAIEAHLT